MPGIVPRNEWGAKAASLPSRRMKLPAVALVLHHTVTGVSTNPLKDMRVVEAVGLSRFKQFSYSFCVHPDGTIMEGCGDRVGAHTAGRNSTTYGVALIGNYDDRSVKVQQIDAVRWLASHLVATGKLRPGTYPTGGHRDVIDPATGKPKSTACPGAKAYRLLDAMREPWATAVPDTPPQPPPVHEYDGGAVKTILLPIVLDERGNGWERWDPGFGRDPIIVGVVLHGPYPPADEYWIDDETINVAAQSREGAAIVTARNGAPGDRINIWVSCA